ncbi:MAG TPA: YncE family protein, partial [Candidatus Elarobacter sp.]|nr:YncE family protein [Candidatus Elarobacter sp.]
ALSAPSAMLPRRDTYTLIASNAVGATSAQLAVHWTPQLHSIPLADTPLNIAISPDGRRAYVCCSRSLTVLDIQTLQPVGPPVPLSMGWGSVTVSPDATRLYIAGVTNSTYSVTALDARTLVQGPTVTLGGSPMFPVNCAVSPDGTRVFVPLAAPGVAVVDTRTLAVAWLDVAELPSWVSISPDGRFAFISKFASNTVAVVDAVTLGIVSRSVPIGAPPPPGFNFGSIFNSVVSPDGTRAYILRSADATVWPIDVATLQPGAPSPALGPARDPMFGFGLAVTPDGLQLLASTANGLCVLQANPLGLTVTIPTGDSRPAGIAVSPDGSVALVALQSPNAIGVLRFVSGGVRPS